MTENLDRQQAIAKIAEMIKDIRIAMLATVTPDGAIHSRPMATQESEFAGELLFLTRQDSSKTDEISHEARVTVIYVDSKEHRFITLAGRAVAEQGPGDRAQTLEPAVQSMVSRRRERSGDHGHSC